MGLYVYGYGARKMYIENVYENVCFYDRGTVDVVVHVDLQKCSGLIVWTF